jgi:hypothetical protein
LYLQPTGKKTDPIQPSVRLRHDSDYSIANWKRLPANVDKSTLEAHPTGRCAVVFFMAEEGVSAGSLAAASSGGWIEDRA